MRLLVIVATILRGATPNGWLVFIGANDSVQVVVVMRSGPLGIVPELPLCLQVPQQDVSLLDFSRVTRRVRGV